jgi:hypothetical protein
LGSYWAQLRRTGPNYVETSLPRNLIDQLGLHEEIR